MADGAEQLPDLTAVIVSRGMDGLLRACIANLRRSLACAIPGGRFEIVVVDNASETPYDPAAFQREGIRTIRFDTHQSFAAANNHAFRRYPGKLHLLLNNDVLLDDSAIRGMISPLGHHAQAGICGCRLLFPDGSIQHTGVVFGPGGEGPYHVHRRKSPRLVPATLIELQAVTGACLLVRQETWDELEGLCEDYPFGLEDIDFCLRARQRGWRVFCCQQSDSLHFESMTTGRSKLDVPSRKLFMQRWQGRYTMDG